MNARSTKKQRTRLVALNTFATAYLVHQFATCATAKVTPVEVLVWAQQDAAAAFVGQLMRTLPGAAMTSHRKIHSTIDSGNSMTFSGNRSRIPEESCDQTPVRHALVVSTS